MWLQNIIIAVFAPLLLFLISFVLNRTNFSKRRWLSLINTLLVGVFVSAFFMFVPIHYASCVKTLAGKAQAVLLSLFNSMQIFALGCEFAFVDEHLSACPAELQIWYRLLASGLFFFAPILTFSFVLSLFKNLSEHFKYFCSFFKDIYVFSELNEKSLVLANDIKINHKNAVIVFTDVFKDNEERAYELMADAEKLRAICFQKDILAVNFNRHFSKKAISFFVIGYDEAENLNQSLKLIEKYKMRKYTNLYVFSTSIESELLLSFNEKAEIKVRRINEVRSLINRVLYERGEMIFESAQYNLKGSRDISAVIVGMGRHGTEMVKALSWFGQMDGYELEINAFDKDPLAKEKFLALAPELMSDEHNGIFSEDDACYKINIHSGIDVNTVSFADEISKINHASYVLVALGNDKENIGVAVKLRMYFERMNIHPVIQAIVYNSQQKLALTDIQNFKKQKYDIDFIGDIESSYVESVIVDSELEKDALDRHLKWGTEDDFWNYEYHYRSSVASAIHLKARARCMIPGAGKSDDVLTSEEKNRLDILEHKRWNAYMRAEGYIFSGSNDEKSRNDLAKMHHDLVPFSELKPKEKEKDRKISSQ